MPRSRQVTDEAILSTTRACVVERGPQVPLEVIADRLGVTAPALLRRFGTREAIIIAALRPSDDPAWVKDLEAGPDDRPLFDQLVSLFDRSVDFFERELPSMSALRESGIPIERCFEPRKTPPPVRAVRVLAGWLERGQSRGLVVGDNFETTAVCMLGAATVRALFNHLLPRSFLRRSRAAFTRDLAQLFSAALNPAARPRSSARRAHEAQRHVTRQRPRRRKA